MPTKPPSFHAPSIRSDYDQTTRRNDPALALAARIRNGSQWRKVRALHIAQHPLCSDPFGLHRWPVPAAHVHHVVGLGVDASRAYDLGNLASLCVSCHNRVERMEQGGRATQGLFCKP